MIAQEYAIAYGADLQVADAQLHLRRARAVLRPDVLAVGGHGARDGRRHRHARRDAVGVHPAVLRDARARSWRSSRRRWPRIAQPLDAYLAQLVVHPDPRHDRPASADHRRPRWSSRARRTSSSRSQLSRRLHAGIPGVRVGRPRPVVTRRSGSTPPLQPGRASSSSAAITDRPRPVPAQRRSHLMDDRTRAESLARQFLHGDVRAATS